MSAMARLSASLHPEPFADQLRAMTVPDLFSMFAGFQAAHDAMQGVFNQPRCPARACNALEPELERLMDMTQIVAHEMAGRRPRDDDERKLKGEVLILWGLRCGSWTDIGQAFVAGRPE